MIILLFILLFILATLVVYRYLSWKQTTFSLWRSALAIGVVVGVVRATLACAGWYWFENHSGPSQIPAYALAMLAWPEGMILDTRRVERAPFSFYLALESLLIVTTILGFSGLALAVQLMRRRRDA